MRRAWVGLALLSVSWLFGLRYYHAENWPAWTALILVGASLLTRVRPFLPDKRESAAAMILLLPVVVVAPWPYRVAPLLILVGLALGVTPIPRRWPKAIGSAALAAGVILTVQLPAVLAYESLTARSHELPRPLGLLLLGMARLLGIDAALDGSDLALYSVRTVHRLGATWELFLDLPTLCFLVGGIVLLSRVAARPKVWHEGTRSVIVLAVLIILWLPVRAALLMAIFMHRALRTEYETPLSLMNQFWNPWVGLTLLLIPVLLAVRFVRASPSESLGSFASMGRPAGVAHPAFHRAVTFALIGTGVFLLCFGWLWDPAGRRKEGRILIDEYHSTWEPTDRPYDTEWYGEQSGYNYACIYDYCSRFYRMGRLTTRIDEGTLRDCDVLIVKVPTSRYAPEEVAALEGFVQRGGGLLLIGEHTNVFNTGTHINDIAERFGFRFRYDCLFDIDAVFEQRWRPPLVAHPMVQSMPQFDFAVSCSIDPGKSLGQAVIRSTGLRSLPMDYHVSNYYPQVEDHAYSRYGAFIQLWATRRGAGRVAAFPDSTVFSNFSTFEPGKAELMLGMLEWLNHRNSRPDPRLWLVLGGLVLVLGGFVGVRRVADWGLNKAAAPNPQSAIRNPQSFVLLLALGLFAWTTAVVGARAVNHHGMPLPTPARSFVRVVMDRTLCDTPLSKSGFLAGEANGFGIFERWILRLGYFTSRCSDPDVLTGNLVVFAYPNRMVTDEFREAIMRYVGSGGKVLILDSPENTGSTANSLLYPFGLSLDSTRVLNGSFPATGNQPAVPIEAAYRIAGGDPAISLDGVPVAAAARYGQGSVTVIGFGSRFADAHMGVTGDITPDAELRRVYDLEFTLLKDILSVR
jgi:hypothetical protein